MILRPYQEAGRDFLASRKRAFLGDEMRLGKTAQAITAAEKAGARDILVVAPAIALPVWQREFVRWNGAASLMLDAAGPAAERIVIASYNRAAMQQDVLRARRWDALIVDEAHFAKNPDAKRTRMIYGQQGLGHSCGAIWPLSGTPAPKHAAELWPVMRAFGVTSMSFAAFVKTYCTYNWFTGAPTGTKESMIPELREMLAQFMLRRTRRQVAPELPELEFDFLPVTGRAPAEADVPADYDDEQLLGWLEGQGEESVSAQRRLTALAKVDPTIEHVKFALDNDLLPATVVFSMHVEPLEQIAAACGGALLTGRQSMKQREATQADFRAGRSRLVCAQITAAGTAIDLSPASHAYFLDMSYVPGDNLQAAHRMMSLEKQEPCSVDVITWQGSVDERVQGVLMRRVRQLSKLY